MTEYIGALVTFVQRFGSSLNLNPPMHVLMLAGVYVDGDVVPASLGNRLLTRNSVVAYSICQCTKT